MRRAPMSLWRSRTALAAGVLVLAAGTLVAHSTGLEVKASGDKAFYVNSRAGNSQVTVLSQSTLEDFTTVCNQVSGQWQVDPRNLEAFHGRFSLRVEDMHTGIELRDHDLRGSSWFDAPKNPEVVIDLTKAEDVKKTSANTATMKLIGTCTMHGKTNPVNIPCVLAYLDESPTTMKLVKGDVVRLRAEFEVKLSDYGITGPPGSETIGLKVSDAQAVKVTVFGATERPPEALQADKETTTAPVKPPPPPPPPAPKRP